MTKKTQKLPVYYTNLYHEALVLSSKGEHRAAVDKLQELIDIGPREGAAYTACANSYVALGDYKSAIKVLDKGIQKSPDDPELHRIRGLHLFMHGETAQALKDIGAIIPKFPEHEKLMLLYTILASRIKGGASEEVMQVIDGILEKNPEDFEIWHSKATLYSSENNTVKAADAYLKALRIKPDHIPSLVNLAECMVQLKDIEQGIKFYDAALKINPKFGLALCNKSNLMCIHGMAQEYLPMLEEGLAELKKNKADFTSYCIYFSNYVFYIHYVPYVERVKIFNVIKSWYQLTASNIEEKLRISFKNKPDVNKKLRIGLISFSFHMHPVTWMTLAALRVLNRKEYELYCYSDVASHKKDGITSIYFDLCDEVRELENLSNDTVTQKIREDEIDILLELTGHSEGGRRMQVAAARVAPVQVKWVGGLFDTTGVPAMDWILGDQIEIPEGDEKWYTERVYRMPDDYIVYEPPPYVTEVKPLPALKNGYVTFSNMNNLSKTNTFTVALWSRVLHAVPRSRLLMKVSKIENPFAKKHFEEEFAKHGIGIDRVIFEGGEPHKYFMEAYNRVDIALDPYPYSGGLSTCEALWMGAPVIALPGETFAGRHAATHLYHAGLEDWIAKDEDDYVAIAVKWANDLEGLAQLRAGLREQVRASPLCDGPRFARNFENALRFMWKDWCDEKMKADEVMSVSPKISPSKPKKKKKK